MKFVISLLKLLLITVAILLIIAIFYQGYLSGQIKPIIRPLGQKAQPSTRVLEIGSVVLQSHAPVKGFDIYLLAFHPMKKNFNQQMEAHHYCKQVNEDFAQCLLFDSNTSHANLTGIEYIISENLYKQLPADEKKYWHPHNYEIFSGQLIAPGLPTFAEKALLKKKVNSYGKTWHFWMTGGVDMPADNLPFGEPMLAWSFNHDDEVDETLLNKRDIQLGIKTDKKREQRIELQPYAKLQSGTEEINKH